MTYILNERGKVVPEDNLLKWAQWFETADRGVARSLVGSVEISTIFLALDHGWDGGAPILWETMAFDEDLNKIAGDRCAGSREQAEAMHELMVMKFKVAAYNETH